VLVISSVGPWERVGDGFYSLACRLNQNSVGGLVTNGPMGDTDELLGYGLPIFSHSTTPQQGLVAMQPWECNGLIECGGVAVRPGDAVVGDQDGVVVVPAVVAATVCSIARGRQTIEEVITEELEANPSPLGRSYPFKSGKIKADSPLGRLLRSKGITPENSNQFEGSQDW
jgi:regulator of RNase E activity RraA